MPSATFGFLGNPESVQVGSGSYSIPAGKYGFVSASAFNGNVTINSTTWLRGGRFVTQSVSGGSPGTFTLTVSESGHYTISTGGNNASAALNTIFINHASGTSTSSGISYGTGNSYGTIFLHAGDIITISFTGTSGGSGYLKIVGIVQGQSGPQNGQIWLKAGDTIDTTGDSTYAISIFPA